ncbi:alpha/beta hydrolase [Fluoribacter dumoffii]|uniref:Carboxylesterase 2 n=1 Tax=Fluoribacter dumoffii TaxID=463 RepID=A0A377GCY4_9GAMM|nr:alpha/beta hydrolase fold domain-containing protein [Fluoribacter dumoffii]KTC90838.1 phospholipase/carboxylesterase [Fluoribacter dumoffii NY 23]MCW8419737.1 alpha/beta hydrolase [Fluoribacter dumoffii]MCW8455560.1 alpha/beta hydrolase [Fluoribacter dumoffii]MCW8460360.1 alpha/beta hydrolase [Fluoribacter dumoffii]MCW8483840.1 alpha/beta hydrolase [Fluoribacter dumoffii]
MNVFINESQAQAQGCVIWMHGLGADSSDMMGLADQLKGVDVALRHVFINAPQRPVTLNGGMIMPAWYDIFGMKLIDREDKEGIEQSERVIRKVMDEQLNDGFTYEQIFLAGFSQGGAMALHTALHTTARLGGVIALSAYLPLAAHTRPTLDKSTSFFMGSGQFDSLVLPQWTESSKDWLLDKGYENISYFKYPMEHSVCFEEIEDLSLWFRDRIRGEA